ncbi:hypothetical protein L208DRAFT_1125353, partial [Tricholoma matsutake]
FWCSHDEQRKKRSKSLTEPNMKICMSITYRQDKDGTYHITVNLQHHIKHVLYVDVHMPPEGLQMIQEQAEWLTPAAMATKIQSIYPQVTTIQIHAAWRELSQQYW